jgi:hypothetical protein
MIQTLSGSQTLITQGDKLTTLDFFSSTFTDLFHNELQFLNRWLASYFVRIGC